MARHYFMILRLHTGHIQSLPAVLGCKPGMRPAVDPWMARAACGCAHRAAAASRPAVDADSRVLRPGPAACSGNDIEAALPAALSVALQTCSTLLRSRSPVTVLNSQISAARVQANWAKKLQSTKSSLKLPIVGMNRRITQEPVVL